MEMTLFEMLESQASHRADHAAITSSSGASFSYKDLFKRVRVADGYMVARGIGRNSRIAVILPNGVEQAISILCAACLGVCVPLNPQSTTPEARRVCAQLKITVLITSRALSDRYRPIEGIEVLTVEELTEYGEPRARLSGPPMGSDLALLLGTSGTTSEPRYIRHLHRDMAWFARDIAQALCLSPDDRCVNVMPFYHAHGLYIALLATLFTGGTTLCVEPIFLPTVFFRMLRDNAATWYTAVPSLHATIALAAAQCLGGWSPNLRFIKSASSMLEGALKDKLQDIFNAPVIETYGQTEVLGLIAATPFPPAENKQGSVGVVRDSGVTILSEDCRVLKPGQSGRIAVRADRLLHCEGEGESPWLVNGLFITGDLGCVDDENFLFLSGREKELINRGGERISPQEVEQALLSHPEVIEAVAFPIPSTILGEEVGAAVVLAKPATVSGEKLRTFLRSHLSPFKVPRLVLVVEEIPRNHIAKYARRGLAKQLLRDS